VNNDIYLVSDYQYPILNDLSNLNKINIVKILPHQYDKPYLLYQDNRMLLCYKNMSSLDIDGLYQSIIKRLNKSHELIVRANKNKKLNNQDVCVLDITAGLGRDALILQKNNFRVVLIEYNYLLVTILNYAKLKGYFSTDTTIIHANSYDYLSNFDSSLINTRAINIYFDPMFRQNKSAKAKKDMQYIELVNQQIIPKYSDEDIFEICNKMPNINKIIVKRDNKGASISTKYSICNSLISTLIRFDIYLTN
jgi:hypothetical protein